LLTDLSSTNGAPKTQSSKALAKLDRQRGTFAGELPAGTRVPPEGARLEHDGIVIVEENGREKSDTKRYKSELVHLALRALHFWHQTFSLQIVNWRLHALWLLPVDLPFRGAVDLHQCGGLVIQLVTGNPVSLEEFAIVCPTGRSKR
jgi:hypothetical protein